MTEKKAPGTGVYPHSWPMGTTRTKFALPSVYRTNADTLDVNGYHRDARVMDDDTKAQHIIHSEKAKVVKKLHENDHRSRADARIRHDDHALPRSEEIKSSPMNQMLYIKTDDARLKPTKPESCVPKSVGTIGLYTR